MCEKHFKNLMKTKHQTTDTSWGRMSVNPRR